MKLSLVLTFDDKFSRMIMIIICEKFNFEPAVGGVVSTKLAHSASIVAQNTDSKWARTTQNSQERSSFSPF